MGNSILFPAPPPSYNARHQDLIWLPLPPSMRSSSLFNFSSPVVETSDISSQLAKSIRRQLTSESNEPRFPVLLIPSPTPSQNVLLYFHGNSCDLGHMHEELQIVGSCLGAHICAIEYPGYGMFVEPVPGTKLTCTGPGIDACARAAYDFLVDCLNVPTESINLFGRSIGTGPACKLAATLKSEGRVVGGLVLHSPYISVHRIVQDYASIGTWVIANYWDNDANLNFLAPDTPVLIMHGDKDEVIPVYHGKSLESAYAQACGGTSTSSPSNSPSNPGTSVPVIAVWQEEATHNAYELIEDVVRPCKLFLDNLARSKRLPKLELTISMCPAAVRRAISNDDASTTDGTTKRLTVNTNENRNLLTPPHGQIETVTPDTPASVVYHDVLSSPQMAVASDFLGTTNHASAAVCIQRPPLEDGGASGHSSKRRMSTTVTGAISGSSVEERPALSRSGSVIGPLSQSVLPTPSSGDGMPVQTP